MRELVASSIMARTTLNLDPSVMAELRARSRQEGRSIGELASQLLARGLAEETEPAPLRPFSWISRDLGKPAVDLEDKDALGALLEK
jgi:plasmid stability protein